MANYATGSIRTIALVGHGASGKTTLAEALLVQGRRASRSAEASSAARRSATSTRWRRPTSIRCDRRCCISTTNGTRVHLIDTPGFPDFIGAVDRRARCGGDRRGRRQRAGRHRDDHLADDGLGRRSANCAGLIVVNKIDAENVDLPGVLSAHPVRRSARNACRSTCRRTAASASSTASSIPRANADFSSVADAHRALVDQVVEVDEELMARYLEQGEIAPDELHAPFEKALREGHLIPVCFVSARTGAGVAELLEIFDKLLPNPTEGNPPLFTKGEGEAAIEFPFRARSRASTCLRMCSRS